MKFSELLEKMRDFNEEQNIKRSAAIKKNAAGQKIEMIGQVVLNNNQLNREYPKEERTYTFSNYSKALCSSDIGYSIFAYCKVDDDIFRIERLSDDDFEEAEILKITI